MKYSCLMYHELSDTSENKFWITPDAFRQQMEWLTKDGFVSIDLRHLESVNGERIVLITFDDGHKSNLQAARIMKELGLVCVFFVVKDLSTQDERFLTEADIKEIHEMGHIIGVHGKDHNWWCNKTITHLLTDFRETIDWITNITGEEPICCSAPGGRIHKREYQIIRKNFPRMKYIRSSFHDYNDLESQDLNAIGIGNYTTRESFKKILTLDKWYYAISRTKSKLKDILKDIVFSFYTPVDTYTINK